MSDRERKRGTTGEPGRALPNLPKFLQAKPQAPPAEKSASLPPAAKAPAPQQPASAKTPPPSPTPAAKKPRSSSTPTPTPKPPADIASKPAPEKPATKKPAPDKRTPSTPAPAESKSSGRAPSKSGADVPALKSSAKPAAAAAPPATPPKSDVPGATSPVAAKSPSAVAPEAKSSPAEPVPQAVAPKLSAPATPVPASPLPARAISDSDEDDVLPQAISVAVLRQSMVAEKEFRPILFAGPLRRVPKALPVEEPEPLAPAASSPSAPIRAKSETPAKIAAISPAVARESSTDAAAERSIEKSAAIDGDGSEYDHADPELRKSVSSFLAAAAQRAKAATTSDDPSPSKHGDEGDIWGQIRAASHVAPAYSGPTIRTEEELAEGITPDEIVRRTPPFVVSLVLHILALPLLALLAIPTLQSTAPVELDLNYATEDAVALDVLNLDLTSDIVSSTDAADASTDAFASDLPLVDDPMAFTSDLPEGFGAFEAPIGPGGGQPSVGFSGREAGTRQALLGALGGTIATEDAVKLGLGWMKRQQQPDGRWLLSGPYSNGCSLDNPTAATAMALLAFLGDGNTPEEGDFRQTMTKGSEALLRLQDADGNFYRGPEGQHRLYSQAQATIAICELYGMTGDPRYREAAQRAVNYCVGAQSPEGGWRYFPGQESDTSVTGWFLMALKSAEMAGLDVPPQAFAGIGAYLDRVQDAEGWRYKYRAIERDYPKTMTAEGVLCRQYLGWDRDDPRMVSAVDYLLESPIVSDESEVYYWYYASQTIHHFGGEEWEAWNEHLREILPALQERKGREQGSWNPYEDEWGAVGGRLFMTALCIYTLEIYYRHLPLYQQAEGK